MRRTTWIMLGVCIVITLSVIYVSVLNFTGKISEDLGNTFWEVSFIPAVNVLFFLWITFFLIQLTTDQRKQKEIVLTMVVKLQALVQSAELLSNDNPSTLLMKQREINSIIYALNKSIIKMPNKKEISYIQAQMDEYVKVSTENLMDKKYFAEQKQDMQRILENINNKANILLVKLF